MSLEKIIGRKWYKPGTQGTTKASAILPDWTDTATFDTETVNFCIYQKRIYRSLQNNNINHLPTDAAWWTEISKESDPANSIAEWNATTEFDTVEVKYCTYNNKIYKSLQDANTNHLPTDPAWWVEISPDDVSLNHQRNTDTRIQSGNAWIQMKNNAADFYGDYFNLKNPNAEITLNRLQSLENGGLIENSIFTWLGATGKELTSFITKIIDKLYNLGSNALTITATWIFSTPFKVTPTTWTGTEALTINADGTIAKTGTITSQLTTGNFVGIYAPFQYEANWTDNFYTGAMIGGVLGDRLIGIFDNGCKGFVDFTQLGWQRHYYDNIIKSATTLGNNIANWLITDSTWNTSEVATTNTAGYGDTLQMYFYGHYKYECISNAAGTKTWRRSVTYPVIQTNNDLTFMPYPVTEIVADNGYFDIPIRSKVVSMVCESLDTTGGDLSLGTADGASDILASVAISNVIGTLKNLSYIQLDSMLSTTATKRVYVNISTASSVRLRIIYQKF